MPKIIFYFDENVHIGIAQGLQSFGFSTVTARDAKKLGISDEKQLSYALSIGAIVITSDVDFSKWVSYPAACIQTL